MTLDEAHKLMNGDRVRWTDPHEEIMGTVSGIDATDLIIRFDDGGSFHPLWPGNADKLRYLDFVQSGPARAKGVAS